MLAAELEDGLPLEDDVELLLPARPFVVLFDQRLVCTTRYEDIGSEGVDPECVLEWVPQRIAWLAVGNRWEGGDRTRGPPRHAEELMRMQCAATV